jgi:CRISPR-associated protein Cas1
MSTAPVSLHHPGQPEPRRLPDYLPVRMVNEFVYCPRLFFYEWVEGVFRENADTVEGSIQHQRVDRETNGLPKAGEIGAEEAIHSRSVTLSSDRLRIIAKLDLIELQGGTVTPVDYKHGKPREENGALAAWAPDRVQLALQGLILRENGCWCDEGVVYYATTKQRVRIEFTPELMREAETAVAEAWRIAAYEPIPAPLEDSPKCVRCSLAPVCLPDEVNALRQRSEPEPQQLFLFQAGVVPKKPAMTEVRRLVTPRDDLRPVYLNSQGFRVGKSGEVLQVKDRDGALQQELRMAEICQVNLLGNVQITTQAVQALCEAEISVCYFSTGGWFYGITSGLCTKNVFLRERQFALASQQWFARKLARKLVAGKARNQRTLLLRNHIEPDPNVLSEMKTMAERAETCNTLAELLGIEGNAARLYFGSFQGMIKDESDGDLEGLLKFDFAGRNRRPPRDAVNALLSLGYSLLAKDVTIACYAVGFDPMMGFYHQPRFGRPALALDVMEPFRPLIVDSAVLTAINTGMVTPSDFIRAGESVALTASGRKAFFRAYELRMDTMVSHPLFGYRVSYRRLLEIQVRLLAKMIDGELDDYPVFVTR